jgi:hypothetical protein
MPTPEELARINIDKQLTACDWTMQSRIDRQLTACNWTVQSRGEMYHYVSHDVMAKKFQPG